MEFVHEVTAYLENKPGRLAKICSALAHEKINIRALSVMDTPDRSVLRLVTDDLEPTRKVLTSLGTECEFRDVLAVEVDNRPGALARVLDDARRRAHQHRVRLLRRRRRDGQIAGHLPHVEPEARPQDLDRSRRQQRHRARHRPPASPRTLTIPRARAGRFVSFSAALSLAGAPPRNGPGRDQRPRGRSRASSPIESRRLICRRFLPASTSKSRTAVWKSTTTSRAPSSNPIAAS